MKKMTHFKKALRGATMITFALALTTSCSNDHKTDENKMAMQNSENSMDEMDSKFLNEVAEINQKEIVLGQLAQQKGVSQDTKDLGKMMEESHTKCQGEVTDLSTRKSMNLMAVSTENAMDAQKDLNDKSGMDFDKKYCDMMVKGHEEAISKFEKASNDCKDADVRAFASNTLPELHKHLEHAKMCQEKCEKMK